MTTDQTDDRHRTTAPGPRYARGGAAANPVVPDVPAVPAPTPADDSVAAAETVSEAPAAPAPFPTAPGRQKGYDRAAVDAFMARARAAFEAADTGDDEEAAAPADLNGSATEPGGSGADEGDDGAAVDAETPAPAEPPFTAATVRAAAFPLTRKGYLIPAVDGALGRIEDAFAAREREKRLAKAGMAIWVADARRTAQEILDRLSRPARHRFGRTGVLRFGYRVDEVDLVSGKLIRYFEQGEPISVEQVRQAAFRMQRAGYREEQVDALLDAVVEVMLAVR